MSSSFFLRRRKIVIVGGMQHFQAIVLRGADAGTTLCGGAGGTDPLGSAAVLHELHVAVAAVVQLDGLTLTLAEVKLGSFTWKKKYVIRLVSKVRLRLESTQTAAEEVSWTLKQFNCTVLGLRLLHLHTYI